MPKTTKTHFHNHSADDESDVQLVADLHRMAHYHQDLLRDEHRNKLFYEALKRSVTSETRVLDIGAGSGVWAIAAAKLGAKKVTAIDADPTMIPIIMAHARENGVADKIEIVHGHSLEIDLRHRYEVIISETIGNQAFEENIVATMIDAKKRFLARGGVVIPQKVALIAAPAHLRSETETPLGVPITTNYINNLALNLTSKVADKGQLQILAEPAKLFEVDLRNVTSEPAFQGMVGKWGLKDLSKANVVALWSECEMLDDLILDTWQTSSWEPVVCRFKPVDLKKGELEFTLNVNAKAYHWMVRTSSAKSESRQSYSPIFAFTKMKLESQNAPPKRELRKMSADGK